MKAITNKIYQFLTKNKVVVILVTLLAIISGIVGIIIPPHKTSVESSPNSINTINQMGGTNILTNNQFPAPKLEYSISALNQVQSGKYQSKFSVEIISAPGVPLLPLAITPAAIGRYCQVERKTNGNAIKFIGGTMYSSLSFFVTCLTDNPINGNEVKLTLTSK